MLQAASKRKRPRSLRLRVMGGRAGSLIGLQNYGQTSTPPRRRVTESDPFREWFGATEQSADLAPARLTLRACGAQRSPHRLRAWGEVPQEDRIVDTVRCP